MNKKVLISTTTFGQFSNDPIKLLNSQDYEVIFNKFGRKLTEDEIKHSISDYDAILAGTEIYNKSVLRQATNLKVISRLGVGLDNIDLDFAKEKNVKIFKTQTTPASAVAELALGLILDLIRKISFQNSQLKSGVWEKNMGSLLYGKTLGIVGLGNIGKKLVQITKGFSLTYLAYDIKHDKDFAKQNNIEYCDLEYLLGESDIVSFHLNLTDQTKDLINYNLISRMKSEAILINTSRAEIIDERMLERSIGEKLIAGAGLDVFHNEPYSGPLTKYDNVILTPHIGSYAKEIRIAMEFEAMLNLVKGLEKNS